VQRYRFRGADAVSLVVFARNALLVGGLRWDPDGNVEEDNTIRFFGSGTYGEEVTFNIERFGELRDTPYYSEGVFKKVADFGVMVHTESAVLERLLGMNDSFYPHNNWSRVYWSLEHHNSLQDSWNDFLAHRTWMRQTMCLPYGVLESQKHKYVKCTVDMPLPEIVPYQFRDY